MSNTGKTSTLNLLYGMLVPSSATSHGDRIVLGNSTQGDFSETITYHRETIFFFTMGDYPKKLELAIRAARHKGVTTFICACSHFSPSLIAELQCNRTAFISKTVSVITWQQLTFNTADAQTIFNLL